DGAAGEDVNRNQSSRNPEVGDHPDVGFGVEGDRRIAHALVRKVGRRRVEGRVRQEATGERFATVVRSGKADVRGAAVEETAHLESGDDRRTECERIGLDLGPMLTGVVGERIAAQLEEACRVRAYRRQADQRSTGWHQYAKPPHG